MLELIEYGYIGLFVACFLAATILPLSSEALLGVMLFSDYNTTSLIIVASIGNWLGGMSSYYLGYIGKWEWIEKYLRIKKEKIEKLNRRIHRKGSLFALLCWLPIIGDLIAVALGVIRVNVYRVSVYMLVGKFVRYIVVAYILISAI